MGKKNSQIQAANDAAIAIEIIRTFKELAQDPLISSLVAWHWIQKKSGLGLDDRTALRVGVIDINHARATGDRDFVIKLLQQSTSMVQSLSSGIGDVIQGVGLATAGAVAPEIAGPAVAASAFAGAKAGGKKKRGGKPTQEDIDQALYTLNEAGLIGGK